MAQVGPKGAKKGPVDPEIAAKGALLMDMVKMMADLCGNAEYDESTVIPEDDKNYIKTEYVPMVQAKLDEIAQSGAKFTGFANLLHDMTGAAVIDYAMDKDNEYDCYDNTNIHYIVCKSAEEFPGGAEAAKDLGLVPGQMYKYVCKDLGYQDDEIDDYVQLRSFQAVGKDTVWKGEWA